MGEGKHSTYSGNLQVAEIIKIKIKGAILQHDEIQLKSQRRNGSNQALHCRNLWF